MDKSNNNGYSIIVSVSKWLTLKVCFSVVTGWKLVAEFKFQDIRIPEYVYSVDDRNSVFQESAISTTNRSVIFTTFDDTCGTLHLSEAR